MSFLKKYSLSIALIILLIIVSGILALKLQDACSQRVATEQLLESCQQTLTGKKEVALESMFEERR